MKVTMLEPRTAALDGVNFVELEKGETYEVPDFLAESYLKRDLAKQAKADADVADAKPADEPEATAGHAPGEPGGEANVAPAEDPLEGLNAKQAVEKVNGMSVEELDAIPEAENRKTVLEAVEQRRAELAAA